MKTGLSIPDISKLAWAYGIKFYKAQDNSELKKVIPRILEYNGPVICEVNCLEHQQIIPTVTSRQLTDGTLVSASIDDMYPFLSKEEMNRIKIKLN